MGDYVQNLDGTAGRKCVCTTPPNTWLAHWSRGSGLTLPAKCCAYGCAKPVEVGAHVKHVGSDGRVPWIVPFCQHHNKRNSSVQIQLKWGVVLVGAASHDCS